MILAHLEHITHAAALDAWKVSGAGLVALLVAVGGCTVLGFGGRRRQLLVAAATLGGGFQLAHFAEHVAQTGYWTTHRGDPPWMTPWAMALVDAFQSVARGTPGFGMEALHLVGNAIFLAGVVAVVAVLASVAASPADVRVARIGLLTQTVHVAEHVALTVTVVLVGRPIGVSTLFGTLDAGPTLWTYRIWWHLAINTIATALIAVAVARNARAHTAHPVPPTGLANRAA